MWHISGYLGSIVLFFGAGDISKAISLKVSSSPVPRCPYQDGLGDNLFKMSTDPPMKSTHVGLTAVRDWKQWKYWMFEGLDSVPFYMIIIWSVSVSSWKHSDCYLSRTKKVDRPRSSHPHRCAAGPTDSEWGSDWVTETCDLWHRQLRLVTEESDPPLQIPAAASTYVSFDSLWSHRTSRGAAALCY